MDTEKKLLGLLKDAAVLVHRYYYETEMPTKDVCMIVQLIADNYANTIDEIPEDEFTLKREEVEENVPSMKKRINVVKKESESSEE